MAKKKSPQWFWSDIFPPPPRLLFHAYSYLTPLKTIWGKYYNPHFTDKETKVLIYSMSCRELEIPGMEPGLNELPGNSLAVQWLGLLASTAGGLGLIPGQGSMIPQGIVRVLSFSCHEWSCTRMCLCNQTSINALDPETWINSPEWRHSAHVLC